MTNEGGLPIMKHYAGYLIDLDGTMYMGKERIPTAVDFVKKLNDKRLPYLFVTNNSTATKETVADRLSGFGVPVTPEHILTTSMATAQYIKNQKSDASIFYIGEEGLREALDEAGLTVTQEHPDFVVIGLDREVTYEKFAQATLGVQAGATFISTNPDRALPTERGLLPSNGALTAVVREATGVDPIYIGKPEAIIINQALEKIGLSKEEVLLVGDNYDTDIMSGINAGVDTLLVFTGVTTKEAIEKVDKKPTYQLNTLTEWHL